MTSFNRKFVTVSIVSHGHCEMLVCLLKNLAETCTDVGHVIITHNLPSNLKLDSNIFPFNLTIIENEVPLGFGANHNQAFNLCDSQYFCVLNPDVQFLNNPFIKLALCLHDERFGVVTPLVLNSNKVPEDNCRFFPTPLSLIKKLVFGYKSNFPTNSPNDLVFPDWAAGMFLLFRSPIFKELNGFDESYFLYYEDIDICLRIWKSKKAVVLFKGASIIHNAQRDSHSNLIFLGMHLRSILNFFYKHWLRFPKKHIPM